MEKEKRKFKRYVLPTEVILSNSIKLDTNGSAVEANILNISAGGVGMAIKRHSLGLIVKGDELKFSAVTKENGLGILHGKGVRVCWVLDEAGLDNIAVGCEFINLSEQEQKEINQFLKQH